MKRDKMVLLVIEEFEKASANTTRVIERPVKPSLSRLGYPPKGGEALKGANLIGL
jgi:hypothetical protein